MKLYNYWRSTSSWRVRIVLAFKNVAYEYAPIHLVRGGGEQNSDAYRSINPTRTVPMLEEMDGQHPWRLSQSMAIVEYLEERHPHPPLLPKDIKLRARVRQYAELINSGIQPLQNRVVTQFVTSSFGGDERDWARHWIGRGLEALDLQVRETAGRFCVGDDVTLADVFLIPQLYGARRFGVDLDRFPRLLAIEHQTASLPAFESARPEKQTDAEH